MCRRSCSVPSELGLAPVELFYRGDKFILGRILKAGRDELAQDGKKDLLSSPVFKEH